MNLHTHSRYPSSTRTQRYGRAGDRGKTLVYWLSRVGSICRAYTMYRVSYITGVQNLGATIPPRSIIPGLRRWFLDLHTTDAWLVS